MAKSLQEQLLQAGLIDKKKAQSIKTEKRKKARQQPKGHKTEEESKRIAREAAMLKAEKDKELNRQRQLEVEKKAITAQIKQLIETNAIDRSAGSVNYQFSDNKKIKSLKVTAQQQNRIANGQLTIVKLDNHYELVANAVADKISQRDASFVILQNIKTSTPEEDEDDPYADYKIPDDLMW